MLIRALWISRTIMFRQTLALLAFVALSLPAWSDPVVKVIYLKADWCPPCLRLGPRLEEAITSQKPEMLTRVDLDMSKLRGHGEDVKWQEVKRLKTLTESENVRWIWDWYGGHPGLAVVAAADTGKAITCIGSEMTVREMKGRLREAVVIAETTRPEYRRPEGSDCPAPLRPQIRQLN